MSFPLGTKLGPKIVRVCLVGEELICLKCFHRVCGRRKAVFKYLGKSMG